MLHIVGRAAASHHRALILHLGAIEVLSMRRRFALADRLCSLVKPGCYVDVRTLLRGNRSLLCRHNIDAIVRGVFPTVVSELLHLHLLNLLLLLWTGLSEEDFAACTPRVLLLLSTAAYSATVALFQAALSDEIRRYGR